MTYHNPGAGGQPPYRENETMPEMTIENIEACAEAKAAAEKETELIPRLKAAMRAVKNHWGVTNQGEQVACAIAAVSELSSDEDKARLKYEWKALNALSAGRLDLLSGQEYEPVGIHALWRSVQREWLPPAASTYGMTEKAAAFDKLHALALSIYTDRMEGKRDDDERYWCYEAVMELLGKQVWDAMKGAPDA
jgi:hypothetical protein